MAVIFLREVKVLYSKKKIKESTINVRPYNEVFNTTQTDNVVVEKDFHGLLRSSTSTKSAFTHAALFLRTL